MTKPFVAILMGSDSDLPIMRSSMDMFKQLDIPFEVKITSAHRTPERTVEYVTKAPARGCSVFICAAGLSAHLAGVVAAHTLKPVIGVPLNGGSLMGLDALLSTVQMPRGVPVATVAIGKTGATNAALLSAQMLALQDEALLGRLHEFRLNQAEQVAQKEREALSELF
jgi:5-(carboxyamino)imidazole ribonucleotide mutase